MRISIAAGLAAAVWAVLAAPAVPVVAATPSPGPGSASPVSKRDQAFLAAAGRGAQFEVTSGKLAADRGADTRIRAFGRRMVTDHGRELQQLQSLDRSLGITTPTGLGKSQQAVTGIWSSLRGGPFDCSYAPTMQADHEADLEMYVFMARHADNPHVRDFARSQVRVLHQHLQMATKNLSGLKCSAPPPAPSS